MKVTVTPAHALTGEGQRLDASYHASPGVQALRTLREWASAPPVATMGAPHLLRESAPGYVARRLDRLADVCVPGGVFIGGRSKRIYVDDPERGIPFLSSSDMLMASFDGVKLISKKQPELDSLILRRGWTLISRSGTIGNTAYVRQDMDGLAGSEHIMRVAPDPDKIPPGYLYAFLSSRLGTDIIKAGTFGSVIDTIDPERISNLPIPRLDAATEERIHGLIEQAAQLRAEANELNDTAKQDLVLQVGLPELSLRDSLTKGCHIFLSQSQSLLYRSLTAWNYNPIMQRIKDTVMRNEYSRLGEVVVANGIRYGSQFKRIDASPQKGIRLLSQTHVFQTAPEGRWISRQSVPDYREFMVAQNTILVAAQGTTGDNELFGHCQLSHRNFEDCMITQHILRIIPNEDRIEPGYLFAFLSSEYGFQLLRSTACGTKLLGLILPNVGAIPIPRLSGSAESDIARKIIHSYDKRADAVDLEEQALSLLSKGLNLQSYDV